MSKSKCFHAAMVILHVFVAVKGNSEFATDSQRGGRASVLPSLEVSSYSLNFKNGYFYGIVGEKTLLHLRSEDSDVSFHLSAKNTLSDVTLDPDTGELEWTPRSLSQGDLVVLARNEKDETAEMRIPVKICSCSGNGDCSFEKTLPEVLFEVLPCTCREGWVGESCSDRYDLPHERIKRQFEGSANAPPEISPDSPDYVDGCLRVKVGEVSTLTIRATDEDNHVVNILAQTTIPDAEFTIMESTNQVIFSWIPTGIEESGQTLVFIGEDGYEGEASLSIPLKVCDGCTGPNENGCDWSSTEEIILDSYYIVGCLCKNGFYQSIGNITVCEDINECTQNNFSICELQLPNSQCINQIPNYACSCGDCFEEEDGVCKRLEFPCSLCPFGLEQSDIEVDRISDYIRLGNLRQFIPFGSEDFTTFRILKNGLIILDSSANGFGLPSRPANENDFNNLKYPFVAPFWGNERANSGQLFYQIYFTPIESQAPYPDIVKSVSDALRDKHSVEDFVPYLIIKVTWVKIPLGNSGTATFQAIIATDFLRTYLICLYDDITVSGSISIGYKNNGDKTFYKNDLPESGQVDFYTLSESINQHDESCIDWYIDDFQTPGWEPANQVRTDPCPWNLFLAWLDPRYERSVDAYLNAFFPNLYTEWQFEWQSIPNVCYQRRFFLSPQHPSARCCYSTDGRWFFSGPTTSRHERFQIPTTPLVFSSFIRNLFYDDAINFDLIPRRQCCIDSSNSNFFCTLYQQRRPKATTSFYDFRFVIAWLFGDPHFETFDGAEYTFNGLGEFHLIYAPNDFTVQARTKFAITENGTESEATVFSAFAIKDIKNLSGFVQFEANGEEVVVLVNGVAQTIPPGDIEILVDNITLSRPSNTSYKAVFPSLNTAIVSSTLDILSLEFIANPDLQNISKGLYGAWNGVLKDDFEFRNGSVLNYDDLVVNIPLISGRLSEKLVYPFGQSWQVTSDESIFHYDGAQNYSFYNPTNVSLPSFLEDLVVEKEGTQELADGVEICTVNGTSLDAPCLYDYLLTGRRDVAMSTSLASSSIAETRSMLGNTPPTLNISETESKNFTDGYFQLKTDEEGSIVLIAVDDDLTNITIRFASTNDFDNALLVQDGARAELFLTPRVDQLSTDLRLVVEVIDILGSVFLLEVPIQICYCENNGRCQFKEGISEAVTNLNADCDCPSEWYGVNCSTTRVRCDLSGCFSGVECNDTDTGVSCGPCPPGMTGNGIECEQIDFCEINNPCQQICTPEGENATCSCNDGFMVNSTNPNNCSDINECEGVGDPCLLLPNAVCQNTMGSYRCICAPEAIDLNGVCTVIGESALVCSTERVFIGLNATELDTLYIGPNDHIIISPTADVNVSTLMPECVVPASRPFFNISIESCGSSIWENGSVITVQFSVRNVPAPTDSPILRYTDICLNYTCDYDASSIATNHITTVLRKYFDNYENEGHFGIDITFRTNSLYDVVLPVDSQILVPNYIYVKVEISSIDSVQDDLILRAEQCWATVTANPADSMRYDILTNGCPANNPNDMNVTNPIVLGQNYQPTYATFGFQSFTWIGILGDEQQIYVHCFVTICHVQSNASCSDLDCSTRKRRSADLDLQSERNLITSEPLRLISVTSCEYNNGGCSDICFHSNNEVACSCFPSRVLLEDGKKCLDVERPIMQDDDNDQPETLVDGAVTMMVVGAIAFIFAAALYFLYSLQERRHGVKM
ncbi:mucin-like protein [Clavelina lepadiformis]|uniref:mucin-like protein n=1 Tax=Clavelina lepadiformis TaxID=159417 RepID=UPI0040412CC8